MQTMLDHALNYAQNGGWRVFPCKLDKSPHTPHGCKDATTDIEQIRKWWQQWPDASIGCACGPESGIWVLDIDLPDGPVALERLIAEYGALPETRMQQTGGGGVQYFFGWNGTVIKNTAKQIGPGIDTRGLGGYIILPPSPHPSGNFYQWTKRMVKLPHAPAWLSNMAAKKETSPVYPSINQGPSQYGQKALAGEIIKLSGASPGNRNNQLNESAFCLGQLIAGGELEHGTVFNALFGLAMSLGLTEAEARKTIESGIKAGMQEPRKAPIQETDDFYLKSVNNVNNVNIVSNVNSVNGCKQDVNKTGENVNKGGVDVNTCKQDLPENDNEPPQNLMGHIKQFIENSSGSFCTRDIDMEFGLKSRKEKIARSRALNYMARNNYIIKDKEVAGKWHIVDHKIEWVDIHAAAEESYPIILPFNLHEYVNIPPKAIIVLAGSTNAGKTAFILNTLWLNRQQKYKKVYLMSEMGCGEYVTRIRGFGEPIEKWDSIQAAEKSYDFNGAVQHHNPDGLTCIDYLEDIKGEYFKIASGIRDIYDALGNGVALIAVQKHTKQNVARGGEGTMEKSRLYMTLDHLCTLEHSIVCALQITKLKNYKEKNLQNHEIHFELTRGSQMTILQDWRPSHKVNRQKDIAIYESGRSVDDVNSRNYAYSFTTVEGKLVGINYDTLNTWIKEYGEFIHDELFRIEQDNNSKRPFLKGNWFFQLSQILAKRKEQIGQRHRADIDG